MVSILGSGHVKYHLYRVKVLHLWAVLSHQSATVNELKLKKKTCISCRTSIPELVMLKLIERLISLMMLMLLMPLMLKYISFILQMTLSILMLMILVIPLLMIL